MGKWFFIPAMANHRLWAFVTHSPISVLGYLYLLQLSATGINQGVMALLQGQNLTLIFWLALPGMIWEITRKTRAPAAEEAGYQTYSQILGYKGASGMASALIMSHLCLTYWLWFSAHLLPHLALAIIFGAAILAYLGTITAFCFQPERFARWLQPVSEIYVAAVLLLYPIQWML